MRLSTLVQQRIAHKDRTQQKNHGLEKTMFSGKNSFLATYVFHYACKKIRVSQKKPQQFITSLFSHLVNFLISSLSISSLVNKSTFVNAQNNIFNDQTLLIPLWRIIDE